MARSKKPAPKQRRSLAESTQETSVPPATDEADTLPAEPRNGVDFPIVGIGASAGGLDAVTALLRALPPDTGMAFVLVQHLDPTHPSMLSEILSQATEMRVTEVRPETHVKPNHVYVIPPGRSMIVSGGTLQLSSRSQSPGQFRPIDQFLRSLAEDQKHKAIGVIMSGGATDGTLGLEEIKAEGGITFAQDASAQHDSMPRSAIAAGCVDFVLAPSAIAKELTRIAQHPYVVPFSAEITEGLHEQDLRKLLYVLRTGTGVDFTNYKRNTLHRRVTRRMLLHKMDGLKDYARLVQSTPEELQALYQDILISVTSFFRNPESFELLKAKVFPKLSERHASDEPIRIWVLGCSTGEEAYSIAIAISEFFEGQTRPRPQVQIFASDLNGALIERARAGVYSKSIVQDVSPERLHRWFLELDGGYRINKLLRDMVVFAQHNSLTDPPFSHMDLISCRNLLIYLEPVLQRRLIPILHYGLNPHGFLWLGSSESVGTSREIFEVEDAKHKLYSRKGGRGSALGHIRLHRDTGQHRVAAPGARQAVAKSSAADTQREADRLLLSRFAPPGVLISADLDILQFRGDTGPYLAPASGKASLNLLKMLREGLVVAVRSAVTKAKRAHAPVRAEQLRVRSNDGFRTVNLEVIPIASNGGEECYLVLFEEPRTAPARQSVARGRAGADSRAERRTEVARLEEELSATRDYLQAIIEQKEAANEELQSASEEVQSANEELQSINEELETSKEEIQSSSEELATVNDELNHRNLELSLTNNDLINLIDSVHMAIVIVGRDLRIRRFSALAEKLFTLIAGDIGRPIVDITPRVGVSDLERLLLQAIDSLRTLEQEVQDPKGRWYSLRIRPYRTMDNRIDGAVMMLVDIDALKRTQGLMRRQAALLERTHEPILVWDLDGPITFWNKAAEEYYGYSLTEALGKRRSDLLAADVPEGFFRGTLEDTGKWTGELVQAKRSGEQIIVECRMWLVQDEGVAMVLETHHAITERKAMERALRTRANELALADMRKNEFLAMLAHELRNPLAPLGSALRVIRHGIDDTSLSGDALRVMDRQLARMTRLLDDLMDAARITHGKIELRMEVVDLRALLAGVIDDVSAMLDGRGQQLDASMTEEALYVEGDPARLEQVFINLLNNASKFSEIGSRIRLTLERNADDGAAAITVADSGVGIAPDDLARVFDLFVQGDPSVTRTSGGLGIGLTLARELVTLHAGSIEARSTGRGHGTEVVVRLPLLVTRSTGRAQASSPLRSKTGTARRVLIVDDNVDAANGLAEVLKLAGHDVAIETSGPAALATSRAIQPHVVVLDLALPGVHGYDVARELRDMPGGEDRLIIALSGYALDDHRRQSREAGFDHHLTKPADLDALLDLLADSGSGGAKG